MVEEGSRDKKFCGELEDWEFSVDGKVNHVNGLGGLEERSLKKPYGDVSTTGISRRRLNLCRRDSAVI